MRWVAGLPTLIPVILAVFVALADQAVAGKGSIDLGDYHFWQRLLVALGLYVGGFAVAYHLLVQRLALGRAAERIRLSRALAGSSPAPGKARAAGSRSTGAQAAADVSPLETHDVEPDGHFLFGWRPTPVIVGALILIACWLVYLVCLFPGTMWYDTSWQVYEYYKGVLSDHHPFLLVYFYGAFVELGRNLFGDGTVGMFLLICIQVVVTAVGISLSCSYLRRCGVAWGACLGTLALFGLFPYIPMMFGSIVKDTLQAALFIYFALLVCEVVRTSGEVLRHPWVVIAILLLSVLICLCKKTGVIMVAPALVACAFFHIGHGGRVYLPIWGVALVAMMFALLPRVVMPALDVTPGGKQEVLAVPIQQIAHEYTEYSLGNPDYLDAFSADDEQLLDDILTIDHENIPSEFDYSIVDPIKDGKLDDESLVPDFLGLWARLGASHPMGHFESWLGMEAGWLSFNNALTVKVASGSGANAEFVSQYVSWPAADESNTFVTALYNLVGKVPLVSVLYQEALWATVLPAFCLYVIAKTRNLRRKWGRWQYLLMISPYLMTVASLFVCPVSTGVEAARYLLPLVVTGPLYVLLCLVGMRDSLIDLLVGDGDEHRSPAVDPVMVGTALVPEALPAPDITATTPVVTEATPSARSVQVGETTSGNAQASWGASPAQTSPEVPGTNAARSTGSGYATATAPTQSPSTSQAQMTQPMQTIPVMQMAPGSDQQRGPSLTTVAYIQVPQGVTVPLQQVAEQLGANVVQTQAPASSAVPSNATQSSAQPSDVTGDLGDQGLSGMRDDVHGDAPQGNR